jgi:hypothetical protein
MCFSPAHAAGALSPAVHQYFLPQAHPGVTVPWYLTDWFFVGLTIVVFAFLYLILKGIETFER